ncbi:MAG: hypothetical protein JWP97_5259 [Labilithrix sp.]|nr:hypothetical protein [Labilithrix sp.]
MAAWRRVLGTAVSAVDRAMLVAMQVHGARDRARAEGMSHAERLAVLAQVHQDYGGLDELTRDTSFFPEPTAAIDPVLRPVRRESPPRTEVLDAQWPSSFVPFLDAVADTYLARVENRTARARLVLGQRHAPRRPATIALHGYMGGHYLLEEAQLPLEWLTRRGLDVAIPVLPMHAGRAGARRGAPTFPSSDPRLTNEGFRQAVTDVRDLARWLRARGAPHVGVMGMSLGGYTAALCATVLPELDFAMPMIPLASIADFAREQGRLGEGEEAILQHRALERAYRVASPFARPLLLPADRVLVVAAEMDQVTPARHAARIAEHFGSELVTIAGGHLVQLGRADAFRGLGALLERAAIVEPNRRTK